MTFTAGGSWKLRGEQSFQNNNISPFFSILIFTVWTQCFKILSGYAIFFTLTVFHAKCLNSSKKIHIFYRHLLILFEFYVFGFFLILLYNLYGIECCVFYVRSFGSSGHM